MNGIPMEKFQQAARVYCLNIAFQHVLMIVQRVPFNKFGLVQIVLIGASFAVFGVLFSYLIFQGYRVFTAIVLVVFSLQTILSILQLGHLTASLQWMTVFYLITVYLLTRAVFDL